MIRVNSRYPAHSDTIKIEWNIGKRCNYDCTYCPSIIHDNHSPHTDIELLKGTIDKLKELNKPVRLSLTGGEPCVHPNIEELLFYTKYNDIWLSVTTNGTRTSEWYQKQGRIVDQFVFSLHFESEQWRDVLDRIIELKIFTDTKILVNVMAHHKHMKECRIAVEKLSDTKVPFNIRRIRWTEGDADLFDDMKYDQNDLDWILSFNSTVEPNTIIKFSDKPVSMYHANDIIKLKLNQYKGWSCNIGLESLMINWDGEVHRATCRVGGTLGNIYSNSFTVPTEPIICDRNYCTCAADIPITKNKI